ncbi:MAG TPA: DUF5011 domain-containing protein [Candidatus Hydrogenedentes bacterium]|nr:DUF5011 domain-containing protein [Candidatus Hydrogenedentota bacterium]
MKEIHSLGVSISGRLRWKGSFTRFLCLVVVSIAGVAAATTPATLPLDPGEIVVTTFSGLLSPVTGPGPYPADPDGFVVTLVDTRVPPVAGNPVPVNDVNWVVERTHNEFAAPGDIWKAANLGQVFGITLDNAAAPNIYVTATTVYGQFAFGPGGPGGVYRIDGTTGAICNVASLPNGGPALGNISFNGDAGKLYVTNMDDGLIYIINTMTGPCPMTVQPQTYDHGVQGLTDARMPTIPDDGVMGNFTALGRRVWAVEYHKYRIYYSVWTAGATEIWSVQTNVSGIPQAGTAQLEFSVNSLAPPRVPVSDIEFSVNDEMFIAERTMPMGKDTGALDYNQPWSHVSRVLRYTGYPGPWSNFATNEFGIGSFGGSGSNSAGGVTLDCDTNVWGTGDALHFYGSTGHTDLIYGLQRVPATGNPLDVPTTLNSFVIGLFGPSPYTSFGKTAVGDLVLYRACMTTPEYPCADPTFTICGGGVRDDFNSTNGDENSTPSAALLAAANAHCKPLTKFDVFPDGQCFIHTFSDCCEAGCELVSVKLVIGLKAAAIGVNTANDTITIGNNATPLWTEPIANLASNGTWQAGTWNPGQSTTLTLDLTTLPTGPNPGDLYNILPDLSDCSLDLIVRDFTAVDFAQLNLVWCCGQTGEGEGEGGGEGEGEGEGQTDCMTLGIPQVECEPTDTGGNGSLVTIDITNFTGHDAHYVLVTPQSPGVTANPQMIPTLIPSGQTGAITFSTQGGVPGVPICVTLTLINATDAECFECCSQDICFDDPCNCALVPADQEVAECDPANPGTFIYTFPIYNMSPSIIEHVYLFPPAGITITPVYFNIPSLPPYGYTAPLTVTISGATPGQQVCFTIGLYDQHLDFCCALEHCITAPSCCEDDIEPPVFDVPVDLVTTVDCGVQISLPHLTAHDNCDGDLSGNIKISGAIDTTVPGLQCVTYTVSDSHGNTTTYNYCVTVLNNCNDGGGTPIDPALKFHSADENTDNQIQLSELLRVVQLFNAGSYGAASGTEDGYAPGGGGKTGAPHSSDYNPSDWSINLAELLRLVQFYNGGGYEACASDSCEDGFTVKK